MYIKILVAFFALWLIFIYLKPGYTYATGLYSGYGSHPWLGVLFRAALYVTMSATGFCFLCLLPNRQIWYTKYGKNTLNVYLLHGIIVLPFAYCVFPPFADGTMLQRILMIVIPTAICLPLFSNRLNIFISKATKWRTIFA